MDDFPDLFDADDFSGLSVEAPRGVRFPSIYDGRRLDPSRPAKFGASLFLADLPPELWGQVSVKTSDFDPDTVAYVRAFGNKRPEVVPMTGARRFWENHDLPDDYSTKTRLQQSVREAELELRSRLDRLGARNLSTDRLFVEAPLRLEISGHRWGSDLQRPSPFVPDSVREALEGKFLLSVERVYIELREGE